MRTRPAAFLAGGLLAGLALAAPASAAGGALPAEAPGLVNLLFTWSLEATVWLPAAAALGLWWVAVRGVNRRHPANPVPRRQTWSWVAGVVVIVIALDSAIGRYDDTLFWVHMVQHLLLVLVAAPCLVAAGPVTLLLRAASPVGRRRVHRTLHARAVRLVTFPAVAWVLFAAVLWAAHFSPLFEAALEDDAIHRLEHALFLVAGLLFWWPVVSRDPSPWRLSAPAKVLYVALQMPQSTFLALAIYVSSAPLYPRYALAGRAWGPTPLQDQRLAGGIMWIVGDLALLAAVGLLVVAWMRDEERRAASEDRRLDAEEAAAARRGSPERRRPGWADGPRAAGGASTQSAGRSSRRTP